MRTRPALLVTSDGASFRGRAVGADGVSTGEVVFNTSMTGYQEIITDPSYAGQIVTMTTAHVGNYGIAPGDDQAGRPWLSGFVARSLSRRASNWRAEGTLGAYLSDNAVVALADVDTRRLTRHIREAGAQPAAIGSDVDEGELRQMATELPVMEGRDLATSVSTREPYTVRASGDARGSIVAIDLGIKREIVDQLSRRGYAVRVVPAATSAATILNWQPDGVFVSNGPGDPEPLGQPIATLRGLLGRVPVFGICLGHQVLGLALGASTYKLPFGHHGGNHPVRDLRTGSVAITAQNHGFAVDLWSLLGESGPPKSGLVTAAQLPESVATAFGDVVPTHQNLNDGTLEGLACRDVPAFSVQYHPEAAPGPRDAAGLFDDFVASLGTVV